MEKKFVVVIDAQNDFEHKNGALYIKEAEHLIPLQNKYLASLNPEEVVGVLFTFDIHDLEVFLNSEEGKMFAAHCLRDTWGAALAVDCHLVSTLIPQYKLEKDVFSMWEKQCFVEPFNCITHDEPTTNRDEFFKNLLSKVNVVEVIGVAADFCVLWAVQGLLAMGFKVRVKLTKGIVREMNQVAVEENLDIELA